MTQNITDFSQRGALAQHLGGQSMPKLMCSVRRRLDASALERMTDD